MQTNEPNNLQKDLLHLYLKTGHKDIESLYIEAAGDILSGFIENLPPQIGNYKVSDALRSLQRIQNGLSGDNTLWGLSQYLVKNPQDYENFPTIKFFEELLNEGKFQELLSPFATVLSMAKVITLGAVGATPDKPLAPTVSKEEVEQSLTQILTFYRNQNSPAGADKMYEDISEILPKKKQSRQERIVHLVQFLTTKFSDELTSALTTHNRKDLIPFVEKDKLSNPMNIAAKFQPQKDVRVLTVSVRKIMQDVLSKISTRTPDEQYNLIRNAALLASEKITKEQYMSSYISQVSDMSGIFPGGKAKDHKIDVGSHGILTSDFIVYVSFCIYVLIQKIK